MWRGSTIGFAAFAYGLPQGSLSRFTDSSSTSYYSVHPPILSAIPWFSKLEKSQFIPPNPTIPALTSLKGPVLPRVACIFRSKSLAAEVKAWKRNPLKLGEKTVGLDCSKPKYIFQEFSDYKMLGCLKPLVSALFLHHFEWFWVRISLVLEHIAPVSASLSEDLCFSWNRFLC